MALLTGEERAAWIACVEESEAGPERGKSLRALSDLQRRRAETGWQDPTLQAAEHYAYMRYIIETRRGESFLFALLGPLLIVGYDSLKVVTLQKVHSVSSVASYEGWAAGLQRCLFP